MEQAREDHRIPLDGSMHEALRSEASGGSRVWDGDVLAKDDWIRDCALSGFGGTGNMALR